MFLLARMFYGNKSITPFSANINLFEFKSAYDFISCIDLTRIFHVQTLITIIIHIIDKNVTLF